MKQEIDRKETEKRKGESTEAQTLNEREGKRNTEEKGQGCQITRLDRSPPSHDRRKSNVEFRFTRRVP